MTDVIDARPAAAGQHTARAFLLAPGIAAAVGGAAATLAVAIGDKPHRVSEALVILAGAPLFFTFFFALVGYATAAIIAVPVFLLLPERARRCFAVVVPLAGAIAAAPWVLADPPWRGSGGGSASVAALASALGVVAGIAFLFLRRARDADCRGDAR